MSSSRKRLPFQAVQLSGSGRGVGYIHWERIRALSIASFPSPPRQPRDSQLPAVEHTLSCNCQMSPEKFIGYAGFSGSPHPFSPENPYPASSCARALANVVLMHSRNMISKKFMPRPFGDYGIHIKVRDCGTCESNLPYTLCHH